MTKNEQDFFNRFDIHVFDLTTNLSHVVAIATEHGFGGIVVPTSRLEELITYTKTVEMVEECSSPPRPIAMIDYPYGSSTLDVRQFQIISAKHAGAKSVEVVAPYHYIYKEDKNMIQKDVENMVALAKKYSIEIRYVIDVGNTYVSDEKIENLLKNLRSLTIRCVTCGSGYFNEMVSFDEFVLKCRELKKGFGKPTKSFIETEDQEDVLLLLKAGMDRIGLPIQNAVEMAYDLIPKILAEDDNDEGDPNKWLDGEVYTGDDDDDDDKDEDGDKYAKI